MSERTVTSEVPSFIGACRATTAARRASRLADYAELTKPRLTLLVVLVALFGFYLGLDGPLEPSLLAHTLAGTGLVAGGAAALNQLMERRSDARMSRTSGRPLPAGRLMPGDALVFGVVISAIGLVELYVAANALASTLAAVTLAGYLFCYTPLKRITPLCTLVGAVPGALPPVIGYTAAGGTLDAGAAALFAILFFWQLPHFLAIATLYRDDYAAAQMPMLPVVDPTGSRTARRMVLYSLGLVGASVLPWLVGLTGATYLVFAAFFGAGFLGLAVTAAIHRTQLAARGVFVASVVYLPLLLGAMLWSRMPP